MIFILIIKHNDNDLQPIEWHFENKNFLDNAEALNYGTLITSTWNSRAASRRART
jgi:hypothetical protein